MSLQAKLALIKTESKLVWVLAEAILRLLCYSGPVLKALVSFPKILPFILQNIKTPYMYLESKVIALSWCGVERKMKIVQCSFDD